MYIFLKMKYAYELLYMDEIFCFIGPTTFLKRLTTHWEWDMFKVDCSLCVSILSHLQVNLMKLHLAIVVVFVSVLKLSRLN